MLIAFLFGPVRAFFNRFLSVLPRVGEQAVYAAQATTPPRREGARRSGGRGHARPNPARRKAR